MAPLYKQQNSYINKAVLKNHNNSTKNRNIGMLWNFLRLLRILAYRKGVS